MANHSPSAGGASKRKREGDGGSIQHGASRWIPQPPPRQSASESSIQCVIDDSLPRLELVPGHSPELLDIISTIDAYETVLGHHDSLAARLGAQMTTPKLIRALDSLFEGTVTAVNQTPGGGPMPSWMEVIATAKSNPGSFVLSQDPDGTRCCRFTVRNFLCAINESDWRLIISGALDRFPLVPIQGTPEDQAAEYATVEILEERLQTLILDADKLAEKARQLRYRLGGRKAGIRSRQQQHAVQQAGSPAVLEQPRHPGYNLKDDLLRQFTTRPPARSTASSRTSVPESSQASEACDDLRPAQFVNELVYPRVKSLAKGTVIFPSCDLCRKRKQDCVKNAMACEACTKKKSKCTWSQMTPGEEASLVESAECGRPASVPERTSQELPWGSAPGRGLPSASWSTGPPGQMATPVYQPRSDANSSSVRRSAEASDVGFSRRFLPDP